MTSSLVGSEMCIRDSPRTVLRFRRCRARCHSSCRLRGTSYIGGKLVALCAGLAAGMPCETYVRTVARARWPL
eukprot:2889023-Prorocentrum_lima.AAC.1